MNKEDIKTMVVNFLDNQINGGLYSDFKFEAENFAEFNGNGNNFDEIEELLYEELHKYVISYKRSENDE